MASENVDEEEDKAASLGLDEEAGGSGAAAALSRRQLKQLKQTTLPASSEITVPVEGSPPWTVTVLMSTF